MQEQQEQRKSTDLICFWLFSLFQGFFFCVTIYALLNGNPNKLGLPFDPDRKQFYSNFYIDSSCGFDLEQYKYIYFTTPSKNFLQRTVCLSECPNKQQICSTKLLCSPNSIVKSCQINPSVTNISESILAYPSEAYNSQICLPKNPDYLNEIKEYIVPSFNQRLGSGLRDLKWVILGISLISVIIRQQFMLTKIVTHIFWGYFLIIVLSLFSLCFLSAQQYYQSQEQLLLDQQLEINKLISFANSLEICQKLYQIVIIISIIAIILSIIYAIYLKSQTILLNSFIKVGGDFIKSNITCIIAPFVGAVIIMLYSFVWIEQQLYLLSNLKTQDIKYPYFQLNFASGDQALIVMNFLIYIWTLVFILGLIEFLTSGMVCEWYYQQGNRVNFEKKNVLSNLIKYHIGSVALGSMLITTFKFIKQILNTTKLCQGFQNRILYAISKHNYVIMNIQPNHFLDCGIIVRELIIKEIDTFNKIGELGQSFLEISRLSMALFCQSICMLIIQDHPYSIILSLYCFVIAYSITSLFISIYGQSSEAIYMLYLYSQKHLSQEDNPQCTIVRSLQYNYRLYNQCLISQMTILIKCNDVQFSILHILYCLIQIQKWFLSSQSRYIHSHHPSMILLLFLIKSVKIQNH
ncbi:unnamed protein product (macronuclear) [Paramecium tetraurelia]|uniref:Choline transporter-like protein n=1 Tax=Paramecium tetraurelia TaxID=5888 RepID=A0DUT2_PARTE|nr:uncharacterized protein GSPATT00020461001 [Paramecium tetraurelia]CAK86799.1 unnamed protein product [Paramecium tetraurelia]|eukprot:XP_001454196.1 hypothetical protein (macronuclear) [Paramecium tetraurelia strain d4-2]